MAKPKNKQYILVIRNSKIPIAERFYYLIKEGR